MKTTNNNNSNSVNTNNSNRGDSSNVTSIFSASKQKQILKIMTPAFQRISRDALVVIKLPVRTVVQDAISLVAWCNEDKSLLIKAGLNWQVVEELDMSAAGLKEAQSNWENERFGLNDSQAAWQALILQANDLHDELVHFMRFAFRKHPDLKASLARIADKRSDVDVIQDLNDLSVLGKRNANLLSAVGMDLNKLNEASDKSFELGQYKAQAMVGQSRAQECKLIRDQAYTMVWNLLAEVRECGRFATWKNAERSVGYQIDYFHEEKKRRRGKKTDDLANGGKRAPTNGKQTKGEDAKGSSRPADESSTPENNGEKALDGGGKTSDSSANPPQGNAQSESSQK